MQSPATTPQEYLASVPESRQDDMRVVYALVRKNLPAGYEEAINWGMITWQVPLSVYPDTYNGHPLMYAALANQKNHMALYLTGPYMVPELDAKLRKAYQRAGKKLDMGKSCLRFTSLDDILQRDVGAVIAAVPPEELVAAARNARHKK